MSSSQNPAPLPDQTVGYENVSTHDLVTAKVSVTPMESVEVDFSGLHSGMKSRPSFGSVPSGQSIVTSSGQHIPPEVLIGPYEILDELGKGGMGVVYRARHIHLGRIAALKMILGGMRIGPEHLERFRGEAEAVAKLDHPNCVRVYDVGEHNGNPYIALELIEGGSLQKKAGGKPQPAKYAAMIIESVAHAVHAAHLKGIVHRDLKPANVLLTLDGQPKVTDFGLAKNLEQGSSGQTNAGSILGTPSYMAPEQAAGRILDIGPATDVYALGAMLYELLLGHPPFRADTAIATIRMVLDGEVVPPRAQLHSIPRDLDTICLKALEKPIHRRYASAEALADDLRRYLGGEPIHARPIGRIERAIKWVRRKPTIAATIGTAIVAGIFMIGLGIWSYFAVTKRAFEAEVAKARADEALDESNRRLVRLNVSNGTRQLEAGDYLSSVLWYAEALRQEKQGAERERMHRIRIKAMLGHCPTLTQLWTHDGAISGCDMSRDGHLAITGSHDGTARVWDTVSGQPTGAPIEHGAAIQFVKITPDGRHAMTAGTDGSLKCWEVATSSLVFVQSLAVQFTGLEMTPDGQKVAACGAAGRVRIWEVPSGRDVSLMTAAFTDRTTGLAFSPDGTKYVVGSADNSARVFDTATSQPATPLLRHTSTVLAVAFSPDGRHVASASADDTAQVWDVTTGLPVFATPFRHGDDVTSVAFSPDGLHLVTGSADSTAQVWEMATGRAVGRPAIHDSGIVIVTVSPDGLWFATASDDNSVRVWDVRTGAPISPPFRGNALPTAVRFLPDGHRIIVTRPNRVAVLWDLAKTTAHQSAAEGEPTEKSTASVTSVTSPNGEYSVSFGGGQAVRIRRTSDHEPVAPPLRSTAPVSAVAFGPDSKFVISGDAEGHVQAWTVIDGKALWSAPARHTSRILVIAVSPDGTTVATSSDDNTIGLWDTRTGQSLIPAIRLGSSSTAIAFKKGGEMLQTRAPDGRNRIWDVTTGEPLTPAFYGNMDLFTDLQADDAPIDELVMLGRLMSSVKIGASGNTILQDTNERRMEWQKLRTQAPSRFAITESDVAAWHERSAAMAESDGHWFAAAWHLDRLLANKPTDPQLPRRRATAAAELSDWPRAERDASLAIRLAPTHPAGWYQRGVARGKLGDWGRAAADLAAAVSLKNDMLFAVGLPALVAAESGDADTYRKACEAVWSDRPGDAAQRRRIALALSVRGDSGIPPSDVLETIAMLPTDEAYAITVRALAEYRAGRVDEAIKRIEPLANDRKAAHPAAWALLAACHVKSGATANAIPFRKKCEEFLATSDPGSPVAWDVRTTVMSLLSAP